MNMNGKRFSEGKARRNGFYLALAVCLVAVGVAAWSTFDAVQGYMEAVGETSQTASRVSDDPEAQGHSHTGSRGHPQARGPHAGSQRRAPGRGRGAPGGGPGGAPGACQRASL